MPITRGTILAILTLALVPWAETLARDPVRELPAAAWDALNQAPGIIVGDEEHPKIQVIFDANCPYSAMHYYHIKRFFPDETIRWVPVSYYKKDSHARALALLKADDPIEALDENFESYDYETQLGAYPAGKYAMHMPTWPEQEFKQQWKEWLGGTPLTIVRTSEGRVLMRSLGAVKGETEVSAYQAFIEQSEGTPAPQDRATAGTQSQSDSLPICPDPGSCFYSQDDKDAWAEAHSCVFSDIDDCTANSNPMDGTTEKSCEIAVDGVQCELSKIPPDDPTYGFYRNQYCIAEKACTNQGRLDDDIWLDNVVFDFIEPLVNEDGRWEQIKEECRAIMIGQGLQCQQLMARYHISKDLQDSVNENGCGSQQDWDKIGGWLNECIDAGIEEDVLPGFQWAAKLEARRRIARERREVRQACLNHHGE